VRAYIREIVAKQVAELFHEDDAKTVLSWWIANEGRRPVVVVGAGFTRNALVKATGEAPTSEHVALWSDVSRQLAGDLRIADASGIDALTLADLHRDGLGNLRFCEVLRDTLKDDELAPGPAHEALFNFDVEAIVTTNFLDTLLDRDPRCSPIFEDVDVARRIDKARQIEVLYTHGHRSSTRTWVLSRSQYEDLSTTRPLLLGRVRQLLSQHPVLTVGFSLVDPDFHQLYRQLGIESKLHQPLGLALLGPATDEERRSEQAAAQRQHWERLGIRIARFKNWTNLGDKFTRFFQTLDRITIEQLKDHTPHSHSFSDRIEFARSAIEDPAVEKRVEDFRGKERLLWRHCIDLEFAPDEREHVTETIRAYNAFQFGDRTRRRAELSAALETNGAARFPAQEPRFKTTHFEGRISKDWELAWLADKWLTSRRDSAERFAEWLHYHVRHEFWDQQERTNGDLDIAIAELLSVVWCVIDDRSSRTTGRSNRSKAVAQMVDAYRLLKDIETLGGNAQEEEKRTPQGQARQVMHEAFNFMMNDNYEEASKTYDKAIIIARRVDDPLLGWLAASGRSAAYYGMAHRVGHDATTEQQSKVKEFRRATKAHLRNESVTAWKTEADRRVSELRQKTIENLRKAAREKNYDTRSWSISATPHFAWRVFRDLEDRCAPPHLQKQYLLPLLEHGFGDPAEELRLRLRFGIGKTKEWLREALETTSGSIEKTRTRDRAIISVWRNAWLTEPVAKRTLDTCIETLPALLEVLATDEAELPRQLLDKAALLGPKHIRYEIARAWREYASILRDQMSYTAYCKFAETPNDKLVQDEIDRRMGVLPWYAWIVSRVVTPTQVVDWLCTRITTKERPRRTSYGTIRGLGEAILQVVGNSDESTNPLPAESWDTIAQWCSCIMQKDTHREDDVDWLGPVLSLAAERYKRPGSLSNHDAWIEIEQNAYRRLDDAWKCALEEGEKQLNISLALSVAYCLALVPKDTTVDKSWSGLVEQVWAWFVDHWSKVRTCVTHSPDSSELHRFLSHIIEYNFDGRRAEANVKLLELWPASSSVPDAVYRILAPEFWLDHTWSALVDKLREGVGGARGEFPASWRIAISSLLRNAILHWDKPLAEDLQFLVEHVLVLVANEEVPVANHAAYTAVYYAELLTDTDGGRLDLVARTLESMAKDVRLPVRQGAAYGAARLRKIARSQRIRDLAERIHSEFATDTYLFIQTQLRLGEAEAEAKARRASRA